jgi:hypothetical protein
MELSEQISLGDLRNAIKEFKKTAPKLTSKKSDLHAFATRVGLIKKKEESVVVPVVPVVPVSEKKVKSEKVKVVASELPEVLKKPVPKNEMVKTSKKAVVAPEPPKKKGSPFSSFMSQYKGKGYSMSQLAQMYKDQKA